MKTVKRLGLALLIATSVVGVNSSTAEAGTIYTGCTGYDMCLQFVSCSSSTSYTYSYDFTGGEGYPTGMNMANYGGTYCATSIRNRMNWSNYAMHWNSATGGCAAKDYSGTWKGTGGATNKVGNKVGSFPAGCFNVDG